MGIFNQAAKPHAPSRVAGRRPSLAELYAEHFAGVHTSVRFYGVPERDAWDVAQDVFVRVHASLSGYDPQRAVRHSGLVGVGDDARIE